MNSILQFAQYYTTQTVTTTTDGSYTSADTAMAGVMFAGFFTFIVIASIVGYVISSLLLGRIFKKASVPQWIAWVPFYNTWKTLELGGQQGFWAVLALIPVVNIVSAIFLYIAFYNIGLKLGKDGTFVLLAIFLPIVWLIWLALDGSKWNNQLATSNTTTTV